jgi:hypothetical protein
MKYTKTISQSLLKAYIEYAMGYECGLLFDAKYIKKSVKDEPSEAMLLGKYFEYRATGYVNEGEEPPQPQLKKDGLPKAEYARAESQAMNFIEHCEELGIEILEVGKRVEKDGCSLIVDIIALYKGREIIIDLKYSGKLYDKWDDSGWALDGFEYKMKHHIQPMHYQFMLGLPFYYFVFSSQNDVDAEFFEVVMPQPETNEVHAQRIENIRERIGMEMATGFIPRPSYKRCMDCPIFNDCQHAIKAPEPKAVTITPQYNQILDSL